MPADNRPQNKLRYLPAAIVTLAIARTFCTNIFGLGWLKVKTPSVAQVPANAVAVEAQGQLLCHWAENMLQKAAYKISGLLFYIYKEPVETLEWAIAILFYAAQLVGGGIVYVNRILAMMAPYLLSILFYLMMTVGPYIKQLAMMTISYSAWIMVMGIARPFLVAVTAGMVR